jgi:cell division protein ZapA (FtsZ GTPase activity inhibitor)
MTDTNVNTKDLEYEVLGFKVRFKRDHDAEQDQVAEVVEKVSKEAEIIKEKFPELSKGQIAVLTALKLAKDLVELDKEYRENINKIQASANDSLRFIEEIST